MAIEATIVEQLQELQRWQCKQQNQLLQKQQQQREMLTNEQKRMYEALSLSVNEFDSDSNSKSNSNKELTNGQEEQDLIDFNTSDEENKDFSNTIHSTSNYLEVLNSPTSQINNNKEEIRNEELAITIPEAKLSIKGHADNIRYNSITLNSLDQSNLETSVDKLDPFNTSRRKSLQIDDVPVPSPKKDFHTLLEERLQNCPDVNAEDTVKPKVTRPFLKKGQGLLRYKPQSVNQNIRPRSSSCPNIKKCSTNSRLSLSPNKKATPLTNTKIRKNEPSRKPPLHITNRPQKLSLKNVPPPQKKCTFVNQKKSRNRDIQSNKPQINIQNTSDQEIKNKIEQDEMKIFEYLEERAENSSFCSTSSTVIAFLEQSTPLKKKLLIHAASKQQQSKLERTLEDEELENIVHNTKSNNPNQLSVIAEKPKESWEDNHFLKENFIQNGNEIALPYGTDVEPIDASANLNYEDSFNESLHVRFSEHNEYKTIGLTDTSSMSNDSRIQTHFINDKKAWSDCSATTDSSDIESTISCEAIKPNNTNKKYIYQSINNNYERNNPDSDGSEQNEKYSAHSNDRESDSEDDEANETLSKFSINNNNLQDSDQTILKSELLKSRLLELEREIEIFKKENAAIILQKQRFQEEQIKLQEERLILQRSYKEKEAMLQAEKSKSEALIQEERKRLNREKTALETRMKDAWEKAQKNKQERQEINLLKEKIDELEEEISQKESKWLALQASQKSQIRVLQAENSRLKQEVEKLQQKKIIKIKKPFTSNTKAIHQINKTLDSRRKTSKVVHNSSDEEVKTVPNSNECIGNNYAEALNRDKREENEQTPKNIESISKQHKLYNVLLEEAASEVTEVHDEINKQIREKLNLKGGKTFIDEISNKENMGDQGNLFADNDNFNPSPRKSSPKSKDPLNAAPQNSNITDSSTIVMNKQGIREVRSSDGHIEYWYPNGNVKKIFPHKSLTKVIFYNGDVQETDKNGVVRYFYADSRTWHTTLPDGTEIIEFPDGQVERKSKDGGVEIMFPDGSIRNIVSDGTEKWAFPDGMVAETLANGDKILSFPNGQKEYHTKEHKRREYPDGTVKLIYPDGIQETRYSNGRVRLKDRDGNLLMDSHQQNTINHSKTESHL